MSFGIGLGAFVDGFSKGYSMRRQMDADRETRDNKAALVKIDTDAKTQYDDKVAAGEEEPDQFGQFWKSYALPKRKMELMRQGDYAGARQLEEWGNSDAALQGGKLFSSALLKAQTGDAAGALQDAVKAGQVKGYLDHGYELLGQDDIKDDAGNTVGFRLKVKLPGGKTMDQDITLGDVGKIVATFANPDAAWQTQVEAANDRKKRGQGLEDYEAKKKIDRQYDKPSKNDDAENYRKVAEDLAKNDLDWSSRSAEEQDKLVRQRLDAANRYAGDQTGGGSAPSPAQGPAAGQVIVDEGTGEMVNPGQSVPGPPPSPSPDQTSAIGLGQDQATATPTPRPAPARPAPAPQPTRQDMLNDAATYMQQGGNPEMIAMRLMNAGISEKDWPEPVRSALMTRRQTQAPGLGQ